MCVHKHGCIVVFRHTVAVPLLITASPWLLIGPLPEIKASFSSAPGCCSSWTQEGWAFGPAARHITPTGVWVLMYLSEIKINMGSCKMASLSVSHQSQLWHDSSSLLRQPQTSDKDSFFINIYDLHKTKYMVHTEDLQCFTIQTPLTFIHHYTV